MGQIRIFHDSALVLRFYGVHDVAVIGDGGPIQVMLPGAVITLIDRDAVRTVYRAFVEANVIAKKVFANVPAPDSGIYPDYIGTPVIHSAVRIEGRQRSRPVILAKAPHKSPSKRGQVIIRFRSLTIVCDDLTAWKTQYAAWRQAYSIAVQTWGSLLPVDVATQTYEARAKDRMIREQ